MFQIVCYLVGATVTITISQSGDVSVVVEPP